MTDHSTGTESATQRADSFVRSLDEVRGEGSSHSTMMIRFGIVLQVVGVAAALLGLVLSQYSDNSLDQATQISLGIAGLTVTMIGAAVFVRYSLARFFRFWLARLIHENQRRFDGS